MPPTNPQPMSSDEIVDEIRTLQKGLTRGVSRMQDLCKSLSERSRREGRQASANPLPPVLLAYANAWGRVAGLIQQAIRRNEAVDRLLDDTHRQVAEEREREEKQRLQAAARERQARSSRAQAAVSSPYIPVDVAPSEESMEDLYELYGKELIDAAG